MTGHSQLLRWRLPAKRFGIWFVAFPLKWGPHGIWSQIYLHMWHFMSLRNWVFLSVVFSEFLLVSWMVRSVNDPNVGGISRNVAEVFVNINSDRFIVGFCLMILNLLAMLFWNSCQLYLNSCRWIVCLQVQTAQNNWNITRYITKIVNWSHSDRRDTPANFGTQMSNSHDTNRMWIENPKFLMTEKIWLKQIIKTFGDFTPRLLEPKMIQDDQMLFCSPLLMWGFSQQAVSWLLNLSFFGVSSHGATTQQWDLWEASQGAKNWWPSLKRCFWWRFVFLGFPMGRNRSKKLSWRSRKCLKILPGWNHLHFQSVDQLVFVEWCLVLPGAWTLDFVQTVRRGAFETEFSSGKCGWSISSEPGTFQKLRECVFFVWGIWGGEYVRFAWAFFFFFGKIFWNGIVKENTLDFRSHLFFFQLADVEQKWFPERNGESLLVKQFGEFWQLRGYCQIPFEGYRMSHVQEYRYTHVYYTHVFSREGSHHFNWKGPVWATKPPITTGWKLNGRTGSLSVFLIDIIIMYTWIRKGAPSKGELFEVRKLLTQKNHVKNKGTHTWGSWCSGVLSKILLDM